MKAGAMIGTVLIAAAFCSGPAHAVQKGQSLSSARAELLRDGWFPVETYFKFGDDGLEHSFGDARILFEAGYIEVETCAGTGSNPCAFNYKKGLQCGRLVTLGEYSPGKYEPEVLSWSNECPHSE